MPSASDELRAAIKLRFGSGIDEQVPMQFWWERAIRPAIRRSRLFKELIAEMAKIPGTVSSHSGRAYTLRYVIEMLETQGTPYTLTAYPGRGYVVTSNCDEDF